jgi:hypothetical protein
MKTRASWCRNSPTTGATSRERSHAPNVEAVEAALDGGDVFAEDQFFTLLTTLGLPVLTRADSTDESS